MPVTFTKRRGKVVGMNMSFAEMRWAYKTLTGTVIVDDRFQECGARLMATYTEAQIRAAVESYDHNAYINHKPGEY